MGNIHKFKIRRKKYSQSRLKLITKNHIETKLFDISVEFPEFLHCATKQRHITVTIYGFVYEPFRAFYVCGNCSNNKVISTATA